MLGKYPTRMTSFGAEVDVTAGAVPSDTVDVDFEEEDWHPDSPTTAAMKKPVIHNDLRIPISLP